MRSSGASFSNGNTWSMPVSRRAAVGLILVIALFAFEIFNFDTTRYALHNLLGDVRFLGLQWASILAIAFCAIDFAGLARLFTPEQGAEEPKAVWYLMGAWLLGATMNAVMTWWAISLTLLSHDFGNEVLSREQLLSTVPVFVAALVWLTRILFIGAFSVAGEHIFDLAGAAENANGRFAPQTTRRLPQNPQRESPTANTPQSRIRRRQPVNQPRRSPAPGSQQRTPVSLQAKQRQRR